MICGWDEKGLSKNLIKVCHNNDLLCFLEISEDAVQHDETYKKAISLLENMSRDISNLKKKLHRIPGVGKTCSAARTSQSNGVDKISFSARTSHSAHKKPSVPR